MKRTTILLLSLAACGGIPMKPEGCPAEFVPVDRGAYEWRVMSARGVVIARRDFPRQHEETLDFVATVTRKEFEEARGYAFVSEEKAGNGQSMLFAAGETASYLVTVWVTERQIVVVEAGGPKEAFEADAAAVRAWLAKMKV